MTQLALFDDIILVFEKSNFEKAYPGRAKLEI
jgi:hypothetical protein